jgi:hypothetical protein
MAIAFPPNKPQQKENNMNNLTNKNNINSMFTGNKILDRMFRKADGVVWDLMTGKIGIQTSDGIVTLEGEGDSAYINQNLFDDFGMVLPAFAQSIPVADVKIGDIIYRGGSNNVAWVIGKNENNTFKLMKPNGETAGWTPPKVQMLGFETGVMVLRSLISMLPNGDKDVGTMQSMLMPMLMMDSDNVLGGGMMDKMMPFMLMQMMNGNGAATGMNMMMPFLMMQMMNKKGG